MTTQLDLYKNDKVIRQIKKGKNDLIKKIREEQKLVIEKLTLEKDQEISNLPNNEGESNFFAIKEIKRVSYEKVKKIKQDNAEKINKLKQEMLDEIEEYKERMERERLERERLERERMERERLERERLESERIRLERERLVKERLEQGNGEWSPIYYSGQAFYTDFNNDWYQQHHSYENSKSCFTGDGFVLMWNKELKQVKDIRVGDIIDSDGKPSKIVARTYSKHESLHKMVILGDLFITARHPILWKGKWQRPFEVSQVKSIFVEKLYNFVVEGRGPVTINNIQVSSLGQFVKGIDNIDSFFGSEKVVDSLKKHSQWPDIDLTNNSKKV